MVGAKKRQSSGEYFMRPPRKWRKSRDPDSDGCSRFTFSRFHVPCSVSFGGGIPEHVALAFPQAHMDMAGIAGFGRGIFGHERNCLAVLVGYLLDALLE